MANQRNLNRIIDIFFFFTQSLTIIGVIIGKKYDYMASIAITTVLYAAYVFLEKKFNLHISSFTRGVIIATILGHNLLGEYSGMYTLSNIYDKFLHAFGTYAFTLFTYSLINQLFPLCCLSKPREFILTVSLGVSLGVLFELVEFSADVILKPKIPNQSGLLDTNLDLILDALGAAIAAVHCIFFVQRNKKY